MVANSSILNQAKYATTLHQNYDIIVSHKWFTVNLNHNSIIIKAYRSNILNQRLQLINRFKMIL